MLKNPITKLYFSQALELFVWFSILNLMLIIPLVIGQLLRLRSLFWPMNQQLLMPLINLTQSGILILLEISIPLSLLSAVFIVVRRWKSQKIYVAWSSLGGSPQALCIPVLMIALPSAALAYHCAHTVTPTMIVKARTQAENLLQTRWRSLIPSLINEQSIFLKPIKMKESKQIKSQTLNNNLAVHPTWLLTSDSKRTQKRRFFLYTCDQDSQICLSAWWTDKDEQDSVIILRDLELFSPQGHFHLKSFQLQRPPLQVERIHKTFGPPNSLQTKALNHSIHHRFIAHKRDALSLASIPLAILTVYLGLSLSFHYLLLSTAGLVALNFGLLRFLELLARAGHLSAEFAAWTPISILLLGAYWAWYKLERLSPKSFD